MTTTDSNGALPRWQQGFTLWLTGWSGSGKSTLSHALAPRLRERGRLVEILDGDEIRENLSKGLTFSRDDRDTNIRRIGWVCKVLTRNGVVAISAAISPYRSVRDENRAMVGNFIEVFVDCPLDELVRRDPKGLYKRALAGELPHFTGISDPYEAPLAPELHLRTDTEPLEATIERVLAYLESEGWLLPNGAAPAAPPTPPDAYLIDFEI